MKALRSVILFALLAVLLPQLAAQRRVTPVKSASAGIVGVNENRLPGDSIDRSKLVHLHDENGNVILVDTVTGKEVSDTVTAEAAAAKKSKMIQPLLFNVAIGVDVWDPVMRAFGQKYGLIEFSGEFNFHNRYIPVVEIGLGETDYTPADQNYTYHVGVTPYFRLGMNYNFIYNGNPDYMAYAGLRFGLSPFKYQLRNVSPGSDYWGTSVVTDFPVQSSTVSYINLLFGIRVKIFGPISMGWSIRYKAILHETSQPSGKPWYIPGYGSRGGALTGSFSIFYTLPLGQNKWERKEPMPQ